MKRAAHAAQRTPLRYAHAAEYIGASRCIVNYARFEGMDAPLNSTMTHVAVSRWCVAYTRFFFRFSDYRFSGREATLLVGTDNEQVKPSPVVSHPESRRWWYNHQLFQKAPFRPERPMSFLFICAWLHEKRFIHCRVIKNKRFGVTKFWEFFLPVLEFYCFFFFRHGKAFLFILIHKFSCMIKWYI